MATEPTPASRGFATVVVGRGEEGWSGEGRGRRGFVAVVVVVALVLVVIEWLFIVKE